ncbi:hypothetical protein CFE70_002677 [Pyrenophora teres f. teres 0-1]|uniref:Uncharacterized protein n=2 Tax=Pyrenophora teres f. teres TaxID=97479 RepID=E3S7H4_PYRTT|nr:hypothetical protein PTT_18779 [Pyrenophora teres f. teres 0-1]KAE8843232.1 hypothetical protein HRS9139_02529 [Pyrenophora teres f. teres]KAE8849712.1 hypothetical protein PTNB85_00128 [Pyrenophora teres f. teres]KAE8852261.1 hypothetical protein HRS9122_02548 [Pyrenophora teres f. teres]KAE8870932.1 hypothetical protein PTNB29_01276 [Pyrenophora teres f. teres]
MLFSTLLSITLLAASAATLPTCDPDIPTPDTPTPVGAAPICQRMCDNGPSECQAGWVSTQIGSCWACCKASTDEGSSDPQPLPSPIPNEPSTSKVCTRSCFDGPTECQAGWVSEQIGSCWACCEVGGSEDPYVMRSPVPDDPATDAKLCQRTCDSEPGECPDRWVSTQFGACWTCCED